MSLAAAGRPSLLPFELAMRELRSGLRGFFVFIACIALGVMSIAGVGSFSESLTGGLAREGRVILGGDLAFSLIQREASADERAFLDRTGKVALAATMRAMARTADGGSTLVEIKAVSAAYPLYGAVTLDRDVPLATVLAARDGVYGAAADPALLTRLNLKIGDRLTIGTATIELAAAIKSEPDKLASGVAFGPRLIVSEETLRATGLLQPGSLVRWNYQLKLPDERESTAASAMAAARAELPNAGWEIRTRTNASPALERNVERFTQYLTLVGLTALLIGGVGVANAVKSHLDRKRDVIATMKALGATGGRVFSIYLVQMLMLALIGSLIGLVLGAGLPFLIAAAFGAVIPLPIQPAVHAHELALALAFGLFTALAFAMWPLGRAHDVPVSALFRDVVAPERKWPRKRYIVATAVVVVLLVTLAVLLAYDRRIAIIFVAVAACIFVVLRLVAELLMRFAKSLPRARSISLRMAIANIHRPGALTPTVVLSLGLGLALLVTVIGIDGNLRRQFMAALPEKAPSFYFVDIQSAEGERFDAFIRQNAPRAKLERVPMLRGRIVAAGGVRAEDLKPAANSAWVLQGDRGITYSGDIPLGSRMTAGEWWGANYQGPPLVSFEKKNADGLGLKIGDDIIVNVLGREISARIANLRSVDWQSLGINFVLVFSPGTFAGAPHTDIATLTYADGGSTAEEAALIKSVGDAFPAVTSVRVKDAIAAVGDIVTNLVVAVRGASVVALLGAVLVLGGALAAGHRHRVYDAVILKSLGATRARLIAAYALEYVLLGVVTALFGLAVGSIAAWLVVTELMNLSFVWLPIPATIAASGALIVMVSFGLLGTFVALGHKAGPVLRNL